jgi:hypothetical protein
LTWVTVGILTHQGRFLYEVTPVSRWRTSSAIVIRKQASTTWCAAVLADHAAIMAQTYYALGAANNDIPAGAESTWAVLEH